MLPDPAAPSVVVPDVDTAGPDLAPTGDVYLDAARRYCADTVPLDEHVECTAEDPLFRDAIDTARAPLVADVCRLTRERNQARAAEAQEERDCLAVIKDRDELHELLDEFADVVGEMVGDDMGEHSNMNDPWRNAVLAIRAAGRAAADTELAEDRTAAEYWKQRAHTAWDQGDQQTMDMHRMTRRALQAEAELATAQQRIAEQDLEATKLATTGKWVTEYGYSDRLDDSWIDWSQPPDVCNVQRRVWYGPVEPIDETEHK